MKRFIITKTKKNNNQKILTNKKLGLGRERPQILKAEHMVGTFWWPSHQHAYQILYCSPVPSYMVFPLSVPPCFLSPSNCPLLIWGKNAQMKALKKIHKVIWISLSNRYMWRQNWVVAAGCLCESVRATLGASCSKIQECTQIWEEDVIYWLNKDSLTIEET